MGTTTCLLTQVKLGLVFSRAQSRIYPFTLSPPPRLQPRPPVLLALPTPRDTHPTVSIRPTLIVPPHHRSFLFTFQPTHHPRHHLTDHRSNLTSTRPGVVGRPEPSPFIHRQGAYQVLAPVPPRTECIGDNKSPE